MKIVMSIAGSDSSAGAGIQADLKTISAHGMYATTVVTAVTAQNTLGVQGVMPVSHELLQQQLVSILSDLPPSAVKIGMLKDAESVCIAADCLRSFHAPHIVLDPVMLSSGGQRLMDKDACIAMQEVLFPLCELITPNRMEAEALIGIRIQNKQDMESAAKRLYEQFGCAVLCKGGHIGGDPDDLLCNENGLTWICGKRIDNPDSHGTGCTFSSAIACRLAQGHDLITSVTMAKEYLSGALQAGLHIGAGSGPMQHFFSGSSTSL